jgi:hypothetical protein
MPPNPTPPPPPLGPPHFSTKFLLKFWPKKLTGCSGLLFLGQELHHHRIRGFLSALPCFNHSPLVKRGRDQHRAILLFSSDKLPIICDKLPIISSVIYWTNQSRVDASKLFCDWSTILRPAWRQPGASLAPGSCPLQCKQLNKCTQSV